MLFRTTYLYRRFLAPTGLRMTINHGELILTGSVTNRVAVTLGEMLSRLIPGVEVVINETVYDESALRHPTGKTTKLPVLSVQDVQLRDAVIFFLESDQILSQYSVEIEVVRNGLCVHATVPDEDTGHHVTRSLQVLHESTRVRPNVIIDTDCAPNPRRKNRPDEESLQVMVEFRLRQTSAWPEKGLQVEVRSTTAVLRGKVANAEQRMIAEAVAASTSGIVTVDSQLTF